MTELRSKERKAEKKCFYLPCVYDIYIRSVHIVLVLEAPFLRPIFILIRNESFGFWNGNRVNDTFWPLASSTG